MENNFESQQFMQRSRKKGPRKIKRQYEPINEDDFAKLISYVKANYKKKYFIAILLAYESGLRIQEVINLTKDDIKIDENKIFIRQSKGNKDRNTILPKHFRQDYLNEIPIKLTKMALQKCFNVSSQATINNNIIATYKLKTGKERNIYRYHFHSLRKSFGVNLLNKGTKVNAVQILLGHTNIATTSSYLNIREDDAIAQALEAIKK